MLPLLKSELLRFRAIALGFAVAHLLVLRLSMALYPLFAQDQAKTTVALLVYPLLGLLFGLYQMRTYRRTHLWAWLVNRPLEPRRIFLALTGAAATLALVVVVLPLLLVTLYADFLSAQWVDLRHYLTMPFLFGLVMVFYFLGAYIATSPRRASFLAGGLVVFFLTREAPGGWIFVPLLAVLAWLAYLAYSAFRPDLSSPETRRPALVASILPTAYVVFWLIFASITTVRSLGIIFYEHGPMGLSTFAWNDYWDEGHTPHVHYLDDSAAMAHGLRLAADSDSGGSPRSAAFLRQIDLADVFAPGGPRFARFPSRHQPFFLDRRDELVDEEGGVRWIFSHDLMRYSGLSLRTGRPAGFLGADGSVAESARQVPAFEAVPSIVDGRWLVFSGRVDEIEFRRGVGSPGGGTVGAGVGRSMIATRFELPAGERLVMPFRIHRSYAVLLSDQRFYLFEPRALDLEHGPVEPLLTFELPGEDRNLSRLQVAEMIDSYLVSLVYGEQSFRGFHDARQFVVELGLDGETRLLGEVPLAPGFPEWYRRRGFLLSPLIQHGHDLLWTAIGPQREQRVTWREIATRPVPARIAALAAAVTLLSIFATWLLLRRRRLDVSSRRFWLASTLLLGLPGAVACWLLTVRDEAIDVEAVEPSPRALALAAMLGDGGGSGR